ncbi:hypothetical protein Agub_g11783, partial [Astrephomene gubernaculifera]
MPPRVPRRQSLVRSGSGIVPQLFCRLTASAMSRYMLYLVLLLVGYLVGTTNRPPWSIRSHLGLASYAVSTSAMDLTGMASGEGSGAAPANKPMLSRSSKLGALQARRMTGSRSAKADKETFHTATAQPNATLLGYPWTPANRTIRFQVCNGFANQRLSIMYGILLARRLNRSAVLPVLIDNGLQRSDAAVLVNADNQVPFSSMYDVRHFITTMRRTGVRILVPEPELQQLLISPSTSAFEQQQQQNHNQDLKVTTDPNQNTHLQYEAAPPDSVYDSKYGNHVGLAQYGWDAATPLAAQYDAVPHLSVDCPLFKMPGWGLSEAEVELIWAVLGALRPNAEASALVDQIVASITAASPAGAAEGGQQQQAGAGAGAGSASAGGTDSSSGSGGSSGGSGGGFSFLHLRIENDWVEHCKRWESLQDGVVRDNCYNHTDDIGTRLRLFGLPAAAPASASSASGGTFSNSSSHASSSVASDSDFFPSPVPSPVVPPQPLYVASYWPDTDPTRREKALSQLAAAGYRVVTSADVGLRAEGKAGKAGSGNSSDNAGGSSGSNAGGGDPVARAGGREFAALVEYFVGLRAERFIGNSVSTFAALGLLERRRAGLWAAYYNGGNIPLSSLLPALHRLPWVFTYSSWGDGSYDYMLKAAVRSALATRSLVPYCVFSGDLSSPIASWLAEQGVTLLHHSPAWRDKLVALAKSKAKTNVHHSHLFKSPDALVSTFQRVDLPVVPGLMQYTYVLYTDADVYFRQPVRMGDFGLPLPRSLSMSYEFLESFPYNAGVFLAHLPAMRSAYPAFMRMLLGNDEGLYFTNYGPADQGALNKFYEADLRAQLLPQRFNAKPYRAVDPGAAILHFHGPKPHDLLRYLDSGACDFFTLCESVFLSGGCAYGREWSGWVPEEATAVRLRDVCDWLDTPGAVEVFKKKWGLTGATNSGSNSAQETNATTPTMTQQQQQVQQQQQGVAGGAGGGGSGASSSSSGQGVPVPVAGGGGGG